MTQESEDDTIRCDEMEQYYILAETVKQNIDYDVLLQSYPNEGQLVQGIYELIVETVAYTGKKLVVASNELPAELVKNRLMKLNFMHIQYVISSMKKNTTEIKNIKKYLLAALYNAPATMQGYYQAEVNHAMPQYAKRNYRKGGKAMIILKGLKKLLVLPIILVLVFIWLIVKTLVSLYEIVHGIVYLFVIIFSILLIAVYGDWLQTGLLAVIGFTSFLLLAVGVLGEVMLESIIKLIWSF